jgi:hypothetical protein
MQPLTVDDLLPLAEYAGRRREFYDSHRRYLDRYRRVRIGPKVTLVFENRQTLWFRVQEIVRVARLADPGQIEEALSLYNRLLPGPHCLQAALLLEDSAESGTADQPDRWQTLDGSDLRLRVSDAAFPACLVTSRPEDRCIGAAHWAEFTIDGPGRRLLADFRKAASFELVHRSYSHHSPPLGDEVRQSLLDDLALSDKDR